MEKHPDKTFIGRIAKGFDFLGYSFEPKGLSIAPKTLANFLERKTQLYEQGADVRRIGQYVRNWWRGRGLGLELFYLPRLLLGPRCRVAGFFFMPRLLSFKMACSKGEYAQTVNSHSTAQLLPDGKAETTVLSTHCRANCPTG